MPLGADFILSQNMHENVMRMSGYVIEIRCSIRYNKSGSNRMLPKKQGK